MYARHRLDFSPSDAAFGLCACVGFGRYGRLEEEEVRRLCSLEDEGLVCLSVRSGWDLWLGASGLRPGDEVLVSAVTHPDMVGILRGHGLRAVPVDLDPETLAPHPGALEAALTPRTRVVLVAHLFGARMELGPVARFAGEHGLTLVEDCAQAFWGPRYMGHPAADVSMYSFGTLKTSTALGGAVLRVRDRKILRRMREALDEYPRQGRSEYARKLARVAVLLAVSRPWPYGLLMRVCERLGLDFDASLNGVVRAFPKDETVDLLFRLLRRRPSRPLLAVLARRLETFDEVRLDRRAAAGERAARDLEGAVSLPGRRSLGRTHWLFPAVVADPEALIENLGARGFDASRAASSIAVVGAPAGHPEAGAASEMMSGVVFLPVYPEVPDRALDRMVGLVKGSVGGRSEGLMRV